MNTEKLHHWIEQRLSEFDENFWLVEVDWKAGPNKLTVFIDCDDGVTLEACQRVSRHLEKDLDSENFLGNNYKLEVSSPGLDRPLVHLRQFKKNLGRVIRMEMKDGKVVVGKLLGVADEGYIEIQEEIRKGKKKIPHWGDEKTIEMDHIEKTIVEVRFKK